MKKIIILLFGLLLFADGGSAQNYLNENGTFQSITTGTTPGQIFQNQAGMLGGISASTTVNGTGCPLGGSCTVGSGSGPIFILARGQSNFVKDLAFTWTPNPNAKIWNNVVGTVGTGTAFVAINNNTVSLPKKFASDLATSTGRQVYLVVSAFSNEPISHWLPATSAPDAYADSVANVVPALAAAGVTKIDLDLWWQGEANTLPITTTYISNFTTMMGRYRGNSWYPAETPLIIYGIASTAISGNADGDNFNNVLQGVVSVDPDNRHWVYTPTLPDVIYWDVSDPGHMTAQGYFSAGAMSAHEYLTGVGRPTNPSVIAQPPTGNLVFGKPAYSPAPFVFNGNTSLAPQANGTMQVIGSDGVFANYDVDSYGNAGGFVARTAGGTQAAPTAVTTNNLLGFHNARGWNGSAFAAAGGFKHFAGELWSGSQSGSFASITVVKPTTNSEVESVRFLNGAMTIFGSTSGGLTLAVPAVAGGPNTLTFPAATTDFSGTGGTSQVVKQTSLGGAFTVGQLACADLSNSGAGCTAATMTATVGGLVPTPPNDATKFLAGDGTFRSVVGADVPLTNTHIFVGNASNVAVDVALSGDATISNTGVLTLASTISAGGPIGSATVAPIITYDVKGRLTVVSSATITPAVGSITGLGTGVGAALALNVGSAGSFVVNGGALGTPSSGSIPTTFLTGALQAAQEPAHTGDVTNTAGSLTLTLATVNANVGTFGSATQCAAFTVNGKGLLTAASQSTCAPAIGSITGLGTGVGTWLVTPSSANLAAALTDETGSGSAVFSVSPTFTGTTIHTVSDANTSPFVTGAQEAVQLRNTNNTVNNWVEMSLYDSSNNVFGGIAAQVTSQTNHYGLLGFYTRDSVTGFAVRLQIQAGVSIGTPTDPGIGSLQVNTTIVAPNLASDAGLSDTTVCWRNTAITGTFLKGSGTLGICLGTSSERYKNRITDIADGLDEIMKLHPVNFYYNKDMGHDVSKVQFGFTAEQVYKVLPALVDLDAQRRPNTVDILGMVPIIIKSVQQLKAENDNFEARLSKLENRK